MDDIKQSGHETLNTGKRPSWLAVVEAQVRALEYGVVQIVVHDSEVVQIETTRKLRLGAGFKPAYIDQTAGDPESTHKHKTDQSTGSSDKH